MFCVFTNDDIESKFLLRLLIASRAALSASSFPFIFLCPGVHIKRMCLLSW